MLSIREQFHRRGFSLLEVVIVVAIIGALAAIAIPRMSRGAKGSTDSVLSNDLAVLRRAIELFAAEHECIYPTVANIATQLTKYSDIGGSTSDTADRTHLYGPYIRSIPELPLGSRIGCNGIAETDAKDVGWIYKEGTGEISANIPVEVDASGAEAIGSLGTQP